jgi:hypothetical protein
MPRTPLQPNGRRGEVRKNKMKPRKEGVKI